MDFDRYPSLGPRRRITDADEALTIVRACYPTAVQEGSTGAERSWTVGTGRERVLVAHHWCRGSLIADGTWWLRMAPSPDQGIPDGW